MNKGVAFVLLCVAGWVGMVLLFSGIVFFFSPIIHFLATLAA